MAAIKIEEMGPPDFKIAGLSVWMFGRQFGDLQDCWDDDWVIALAHCGAEGAAVQVSGSFLHLSELRRWLDKLYELHRTMSGTAELDCIEPNLNAKIELRDGRGTLVVDITADHLTQKHRFTFEVDQSYLPDLTTALERVLQEYPVRGKP